MSNNNNRNNRNNRKDSTMDPRHVWIYHERQESLLCGQHALNNLVQQPATFTVDVLAQVAQDLDALELQYLSESNDLQQNIQSKDSYERQGNEGSSNVDAQGNFSIQVLKTCFNRFVLQQQGGGGVSDGTTTDFLRHWTPSLMADANVNANVNIQDITEFPGFVLHKSDHWFTIRQINGRFFNLNSTLPYPLPISHFELGTQLTQAQSSYTVFCVTCPFLPPPHVGPSPPTSSTTNNDSHYHNDNIHNDNIHNTWHNTHGTWHNMADLLKQHQQQQSSSSSSSSSLINTSNGVLNAFAPPPPSPTTNKQDNNNGKTTTSSAATSASATSASATTATATATDPWKKLSGAGRRLDGKSTTATTTAALSPPPSAENANATTIGTMNIDGLSEDEQLALALKLSSQQQQQQQPQQQQQEQQSQSTATMTTTNETDEMEIPPEPPVTAPHVCRIQFRFPNGKSVVRRFHKHTTTVAGLYRYCEHEMQSQSQSQQSQSQQQQNVQLRACGSFPPRNLQSLPPQTTLEQAQLTQGESIQVNILNNHNSSSTTT